MSKITIKLVRPTTQKLPLVKLIKDCSNLGLKESKDICDNLHSNPSKSCEIPIRQSDGIDFRRRFIDGLKDIDGQFIVNGGAQWERNIKMLQLGIGEKDDYIEAISEDIKSSNSDNLLLFVLGKLTKEELKDAFNQIKIEL